MMDVLELFYSDSDPSSAEILQFVQDKGLTPRIKLRNRKDASTQMDFEANHGERWPAIYDGEHIVDGKAAVMAILSGLTDET